ncbi:adhesion G-protein coupled receptor G5-like [Narcine bancroftii]|uniref:adhesion G-protein coupled receptor G5-like n=1 Tax=Narcine bancroftii TaxID=1343680 RepID=UPI0038314366
MQEDLSQHHQAEEQLLPTGCENAERPLNGSELFSSEQPPANPIPMPPVLLLCSNLSQANTMEKPRRCTNIWKIAYLILFIFIIRGDQDGSDSSEDQDGSHSSKGRPCKGQYKNDKSHDQDGSDSSEDQDGSHSSKGRPCKGQYKNDKSHDQDGSDSSEDQDGSHSSKGRPCKGQYKNDKSHEMHCMNKYESLKCKDVQEVCQKRTEGKRKPCKLARKCLELSLTCKGLEDGNFINKDSKFKLLKLQKFRKHEKLVLISNSSWIGERTFNRQNADVEVILPAELYDRAQEQQNDLSSINFFICNDHYLFEVENNTTILNDQVFGIIVGNTSIRNLTEGVTIKINHTMPNASHRCVFFFEDENISSWNSTGCNTTIEGKQTICMCDHLTYFAVLLDFNMNDNTLGQNVLTSLTYITRIGCGISAIFTAITVLHFWVIRKLKGNDTTKIHINLCIACFLLNTNFLINEWFSDLMIDGLCKTLAVFLHYSLLCLFTWMAIEGLHLYLMIVKVFNIYVKHYIQKMALVGWGFPAVVVSLCVGVRTDQYDQFQIETQNSNNSVSMCWISDKTIHYVTNCGFFSLVWLENFVILITVCIKLVKMQKGSSFGSRSVYKKLWTFLGLSYLLGITWGLAFLSHGPLRVVQIYLFSIFNSLQGFMIFLWYWAIQQPVKEQTTNDMTEK